MCYSTCTDAIAAIASAVVNAADALTGPAGAPGGKQLQKCCNIL